MTLALVLLAWLACVASAAAEDAPILADPVDYYPTAVLADIVPGMRRDVLIRIRRDFNNDGREDQAFTVHSVCGNAMCHFELWLQDDSQRYRLVGNLPILPWGYGLVAREPGVAELQTCSGTGVEFWGTSAYRISATGVTDDEQRSELLSKTGRCEIAELASYPCEECWVKELVKRKRCRWRACPE